MIDGVIINQLMKYKDERGWVCEFFRNDDSEYRPEMVYASLTNPGVVRGPHEHAYQSDYFIFPGPGEFEIHLWDRRDNSDTKGEYLKIEAGEENPITLLVPPGVVHGYKCVSDIPANSYNLPDKLYKGEGKNEEVDEIRWENDPESPYKIL
jgi:dTDP-4-dehydrorhamnose 3,5-epimerase